MNNKDQIGIGILNKQHLKDNAIIQNYAYGGSLSLLEGSTINKQKYTQSLPSVRYADGGDTKLEWSELSITDKAPWIRFLVSKGITSAKGMEDAYNKYAMGGPGDPPAANPMGSMGMNITSPSLHKQILYDIASLSPENDRSILDILKALVVPNSHEYTGSYKHPKPTPKLIEKITKMTVGPKELDSLFLKYKDLGENSEDAVVDEILSKYHPSSEDPMATVQFFQTDNGEVAKVVDAKAFWDLLERLPNIDRDLHKLYLYGDETGFLEFPTENMLGPQFSNWMEANWDLDRIDKFKWYKGNFGYDGDLILPKSLKNLLNGLINSETPGFYFNDNEEWVQREDPLVSNQSDIRDDVASYRGQFLRDPEGNPHYINSDIWDFTPSDWAHWGNNLKSRIMDKAGQPFGLRSDRNVILEEGNPNESFLPNIIRHFNYFGKLSDGSYSAILPDLLLFNEATVVPQWRGIPYSMSKELLDNELDKYQNPYLYFELKPQWQFNFPHADGGPLPDYAPSSTSNLFALGGISSNNSYNEEEDTLSPIDRYLMEESTLGILDDINANVKTAVDAVDLLKSRGMSEYEAIDLLDNVDYMDLVYDLYLMDISKGKIQQKSKNPHEDFLNFLANISKEDMYKLPETVVEYIPASKKTISLDSTGELKDLNWETFRDHTWQNETSRDKRGGYDKTTGLWYPVSSYEGGSQTIGPGLKLNKNGERSLGTPSLEEAKKGMTEEQLNFYLKEHYEENLRKVNEFINLDSEGSPADTVSPQIKLGLMDLRHLVGPLGTWKNLRKAVQKGDIKGIRREGRATITDTNGNSKYDERRNNLRNTTYFYYDNPAKLSFGGPLQYKQGYKYDLSLDLINDLIKQGYQIEYV